MLLLAPKSFMGTVPPHLFLDLVPAFLSINPPGSSMQLCLTSIPWFLFLSSSFPKLPFSHYFLILHPFPTRACSSHWGILV